MSMYVSTQKQYLASFFILAALFAPGAQAAQVSVNPGTVGFGAIDLQFFLIGDATEIDITFTDNKTLEYQGDLTFNVQPPAGIGTPFIPYTGFFTDASGNKITGTDFSGTSETLPDASVSLSELTVWYGIHFEGEFPASLGIGPYLAPSWNGDTIGPGAALRPTVGVVPIPAAGWLFVSAIGLLGWMRRKAT